MGTRLHHEAATADLITDILAPALSRSADVAALVRCLEAGPTCWLGPWPAGTDHPDPVTDHPYAEGLTSAEDDELRHLNYLAEHGKLADLKAERLIGLRLRDRRKDVRPPRGFIIEETIPPKRRWYRLRNR